MCHRWKRYSASIIARYAFSMRLRSRLNRLGTLNIWCYTASVFGEALWVQLKSSATPCFRNDFKKESDALRGEIRRLNETIFLMQLRESAPKLPMNSEEQTEKTTQGAETAVTQPTPSMPIDVSLSGSVHKTHSSVCVFVGGLFPVGVCGRGAVGSDLCSVGVRVLLRAGT